MLSETIVQVQSQTYMIQRGKPCSCVGIKIKERADVTTYLDSQDIRYHFEELSPGWCTLWLYDHEFMLEVIKASPDTPRTVYDHWILGKMFGYSDEAIKKFCADKPNE